VQPVLRARIEPVRSGHELAQLLDACSPVRRRTRNLIAPTAGRDGRPPGSGELGSPAKLFGAHECVEQVELESRPREAPLLELAGHGEEPVDERCDLLPRDAAPPGVRPGPPVNEDPARDRERLLVPRTKLRERGERLVVEHALGQVQLRLDVCLRPGRAHVARVAPRPEQEADRLREDRLPRARLARDRVQAGGKGQIRLTDEDEVLDAQVPDHQENTWW
jgi:hypothetical protein